MYGDSRQRRASGARLGVPTRPDVAVARVADVEAVVAEPKHAVADVAGFVREALHLLEAEDLDQPVPAAATSSYDEQSG